MHRGGRGWTLVEAETSSSGVRAGPDKAEVSSSSPLRPTPRKALSLGCSLGGPTCDLGPPSLLGRIWDARASVGRVGRVTARWTQYPVSRWRGSDEVVVVDRSVP